MILPLDADSKMPFGQHKGRRMEDVPASYLLWLYDKDDGLWKDMTDRNMPLRLYIEEVYSTLISDTPDFDPKHPYKPSR